jgi:hypothetical protein
MPIDVHAAGKGRRHTNDRVMADIRGYPCSSLSMRILVIEPVKLAGIIEGVEIPSKGIKEQFSVCVKIR